MVISEICLLDLGCNPKHVNPGLKSTQTNGTDFWVGMQREDCTEFSSKFQTELCKKAINNSS